MAGATVQWPNTQALIMLSDLVLRDASSVLIKDVTLRNPLSSQQYSSTSCIVAQTCTLLNASSFTFQNINVTLNASGRTFLVKTTGINFVNNIVDASMLRVQRISCSNRVNELSPLPTDPGYALCVLLAIFEIRNHSAVVVDGVTTVSSNTFGVLYLQDILVRDQSSVALLSSSLITLLPAARVIFRAVIPNVVITILRLTSTEGCSIDLLVNSTVTPMEITTQVGQAADLTLASFVNCTLDATDILISNTDITLPAAQCATLDPTADVIRVTLTTLSLNTTVTLEDVTVRNVADCSSLVVVEDSAVGDGALKINLLKTL